MSTPTNGVPPEGNLSPEDDSGSIQVAPRTQPDQHSPEPTNGAVDHSPHSPTPENIESPIQAEESRPYFESESSDNDNASEDAAFDMEESPISPHEEDAPRERQGSSDSSSSLKRKAPGGESDYINANPELYGLRRSVCILLKYIPHQIKAILLTQLQGRAAKQRAIVRLPLLFR